MNIIQILIDNPLLLLFLVAGIGYPLGRLRIAGASLGVAAVLFVGLAAGSLHPDLQLPETIYQLGLVLFVYTIGLSSGSIFFASLRRKGLRDNALAAIVLVFAAALTLLIQRFTGLNPALTAGMFSGGLTNTPALAAVVEYVKQAAPTAAQLQADPVIAYSLTYPVGILGVILAIILVQKIWKIDYASETHVLRQYGASNEPLTNRTLEITSHEVAGRTVAELARRHHWNVLFGRIKQGSEERITTGSTVLSLGDEINMVGTLDELDAASEVLGQPCDDRLDLDLTRYDKRRFFVSNPQVAGRPLRSLDLSNTHGAIVTRVRRGDVELLPRGDTVLALGDQVRVVAPPERMTELAGLFGDSYRGVSEIDILTFSLGLALGMAVGMLPIPLPGGFQLKLGLAGGPLVVALALGALGRTGPIVWDIPYSANLTLRQVGLVLFLAGVGTRSGYAFVTTLGSGSGLAVFLGGAVLTTVTALFGLLLGHYWLKIPMGILTGVLAGIHTQPAVLSFAAEQAKNDLPNIGYAVVYPVAVIIKIVLAQVILTILMSG